MSAFISPVFGAAVQLLNNTGGLLAGGQIFTYLAGTTNAAATWTTSTQGVQNANPIVLDSAGRTTSEIWLQGGQSYKFIVQDSNGVQVGPTYDNIAGINDANYNPFSEWVSSGVTPTYVSATQFTAAGNLVSTFQVGRRVQYYLGGGTYYGSISASSFNGGTGLTTVTITADSTGLDNTLFAVSYGFMSAVNYSLPVSVYAPLINASFTGLAATGTVTMSGATTVTVPTASPGDNSTKAASTAFATALSFAAALPAQATHADNVTTTDGSTASWTPNLKATVIRFKDGTDATKLLAFSLSGLTTATTRTVTIPDKSGTMAMTSDLVLTKAFTSSEQIITAAGALTIAHSLGAIPKLVMGYLKCVTGELNYSIGDVVCVPVGQADLAGAGAYGVSVVADATNLNVRYASNAGVFVVIDKTTGAGSVITAANWTFSMRAFT